MMVAVVFWLKSMNVLLCSVLIYHAFTTLEFMMSLGLCMEMHFDHESACLWLLYYLVCFHKNFTSMLLELPTNGDDMFKQEITHSRLDVRRTKS